MRIRKHKGLYLLLVISLISVFSVYSSSSAREITRSIRIGVASMITPVDAVKYYQDIVDFISERVGAPVEMIHRRTYDEMDRMLERGEVDAAFICSAPYVKNRREFGVELLVAPIVNGSTFYHSYIIVHRDSPYRTLQDLEGKTFAFTDPKSNSGKLYPEYVLAKMGISPDRFFSKYIYSYSHNKSIELVAKKVVDGAAVESLVYHYMEKKGSPYVKETRIIGKSPPFGIPPVVVSTNTPLFIKEKLREILLNMHKSSEGKAILNGMLIDRFMVVPDRNYDSIRKMEHFLAGFRSPQKSEKTETDTIHFGVIPRDNPRIAYEKYQPIVDYLTEDTGMKVELVLKKSYEETVTGLSNGSIDIALLGPLTYLEARAKAGAVAVLRSVTDKGESFYRSVIIARQDSPVEKLQDMKGKAFAFASVKSTSGNLIPRYLLAENGIHLRELSRFRNFDYHDSVVKWVLKGEFDAGAVREAVAEKYLPLGLKIILKSRAIPTGPVVIGPKTPYPVAERIKRSLLKMGDDPVGKTFLSKTDPELRGGFIEARDSDYQGIRKMINDVPGKCGAGCHPKIRL